MSTINIVPSSTGDSAQALRPGWPEQAPDTFDVAQFEALLAGDGPEIDIHRPAGPVNPDHVDAAIDKAFDRQLEKSVLNSTLQALMKNQDEMKKAQEEINGG